MKDSVLKIAALTLLLIVFTAVALTARWANESDYDYINQPSKVLDGTSSKVNGYEQQRSSTVNAQADGWDTGTETEFSTLRADRPDVGSKEKQWQRGSAEDRVNRLIEEQDDGGEPPDDRKDTYGNDDVE